MSVISLHCVAVWYRLLWVCLCIGPMAIKPSVVCVCCAFPGSLACWGFPAIVILLYLGFPSHPFLGRVLNSGTVVLMLGERKQNHFLFDVFGAFNNFYTKSIYLGICSSIIGLQHKFMTSIFSWIFFGISTYYFRSLVRIWNGLIMKKVMTVICVSLSFC